MGEFITIKIDWNQNARKALFARHFIASALLEVGNPRASHGAHFASAMSQTPPHDARTTAFTLLKVGLPKGRYTDDEVRHYAKTQTVPLSINSVARRRLIRLLGFVPIENNDVDVAPITATMDSLKM